MSLTLITYYWGDEAGQGFLHGFACMVLFISAPPRVTFGLRKVGGGGTVAKFGNDLQGRKFAVWGLASNRRVSRRIIKR